MLKSLDDIVIFKQHALNRALFMDKPILCISRKILEKSGKDFFSGFPGTTLYAVKSNPHSLVLKALIKIGITHFDTASLEEVRLVKSINKTAKCYFNHPIKTRREIREAYHNYGVKDFVIDSREEWDKISSEINIHDIVVQFRLNTKTGSTIYDFSHKFGMQPEDISKLAAEIAAQKIDWALSFHVGSQCIDPNAFGKALLMCQSIMEKVKIKPKYINVGGGFPGDYPNADIPKLHKYFEKIRQIKAQLNLPDLLCEPGRALVCHAGFLIVQILARKNDKLYINDGVYGALGELNYAKLNLNTTAISFNRFFSSQYREFKVFGPTCDSFDTLDCPFKLPEDVDEGDWIIISDLGAYSTALTSHFNGFCSNTIVIVD